MKMTLLNAILKRVQSNESLRKFPSPPPEIDETVIKSKKKKHNQKSFQYEHIKPVVDSSAPGLDLRNRLRNLEKWGRDMRQLIKENMKMVTIIKRQHFLRGRVDSRWPEYPSVYRQHYENRKHFYKRLRKDNCRLYDLITKAKARVPCKEFLDRDWKRNKTEMIGRSRREFVLFYRTPKEEIEDVQFKPARGVKRPRVYFTLRFRDGAVVGDLPVELFTDVCPLTCRLFLDLMDGDGLGHGYVGTCFFRKVPNLFWSGGDVIYNNGFGCYAQRGRAVPIGAENYHFPHSIPGLLSMRMTGDDEMCGIFNITFKPLLQFDLKNVVFGRVLRPNNTYDFIRGLGSPLSVQPIIEVAGMRRYTGKHWVYGQPNTKLKERSFEYLRDKMKKYS